MRSKEIFPESKRDWIKKLDRTNPNYNNRVITLVKALLAAEEELEKGGITVVTPPPPIRWTLEKVERYKYSTGRNFTNYVEISYWYSETTLERKETKRQIDILDSNTHKLPDWALTITERRKDLELQYY